MRSFITTLALGLALFASSCAVIVADDDDVPAPTPQGDLSVFWTFDGLGGCGDTMDVWVKVTDPDGYEYDDARYPCSFDGVEYDRLEEGYWTVELIGIDYGDRVNFRSGERSLLVLGDAHNEYTMDLRSVRR